MAIVKFRRGDGAEFEVEEGSPAYERILAHGGFERAVVYHFADVYERSPADRDFVTTIIDQLDGYENSAKIGSNKED